ncbi:MAG: M23 family metallopeptidase, partial [Vicinamibacteria bacterium]
MGVLSGLLFLLFCIVWTPGQDVSAGAPTVPSAEPAPDPSSKKVLARLNQEDLLFPVPAVTPKSMANSFTDSRGKRIHHAVDILAPRHSEIVAVVDGTVARMMSSVAGGIAVYQYDDDHDFVFYYAHLQGYAPGLKEGDSVKRGQVLGYVGTTGNAPANTPHLHFAIA